MNNITNYEFIERKDDNIHIYFSTAKGELDFNKNTDKGIENLNNIKQWFQLDEIGYLNQVHSDITCIYDGEIHNGDSIITKKKNIAIGVFNADCVPVLMYDKKKEVIAAVHSGWKGTLKCIVEKTIDRIRSEYNVNPEDLVVYIGPHNMECCYQVSEELIQEFKNQEIYKDLNISKGRNLSLQSCIVKQLLNKGVKFDKIYPLNICTYCDDKHVLHSYRKTKEKCGRMFSFIFIK